MGSIERSRQGQRRLARALAPALLVALCGALLGCTHTPPRAPDDLCAIFHERPGWYRAALKTEKRWGVPAPVAMAFVHKESSYVAKARPPRGRLLWVIPWRRPSSAYGYAQATDEAWHDYRAHTGRSFVDRDDFADALDFIGWYNHRSARKLGIATHDAYHLYVAYYEGPSGYASGKWRKDARVKGYASRVASRAQRYRAQLERCRDELPDSWWRRIF
ncbi:MAG: hypothetical protein R3E86_01540 [Pseudomonadales bacterium]